MPTQRMIELTLQVTTDDEAAAVTAWELLSRTALGLRLSHDVFVTLEPATYEQHCVHPDHDEVES